VYDRFVRSFDAYRRYIAGDLEPEYRDAGIAVFGVNTARRLTLKGGRISRKQIACLEHKLCSLSEDTVKVVVTHHPFDLPSRYTTRSLARRAAAAMERLSRCRVDLLLAGHLHVSYCGPTALRYDAAGHSAVFVQAGTACSTRSRGELNSFNVIEIDAAEMRIHLHSASAAGSFEHAGVECFRRSGNGWERVAS
jgi:3',5'-cyclic AMP phosphodiesterase CpdA